MTLDDGYDYKASTVRVVNANGRMIVEVATGCTGFVTVAVRERKETADAIASGLRELLSKHKD